jgi:serine/threonine protein kinase
MTERIGLYRVIREIGEGGFGSVYLVEKEGKPFALKQLLKGGMDPEVCERFFREAMRVEEIRKKYKADYLAQVHEVLFDENAFVMDFIPENIQQYLSRTNDVLVLQRLIAAVQKLHAAGIAHRDIKPANIRVADTRPVLLDFGLSSWWDSKSNIMPIGTRYYSPPEIVCMFDEYRNSEAARRTNLEIIGIMPEDVIGRGKLLKSLHDVYSLGMTIGELLTGTLPFNANSYESYLQKGSCHEYESWLRKVAEPFRSFVSEATRFSPLQRPKLDTLVASLGSQGFSPSIPAIPVPVPPEEPTESPTLCLCCQAVSQPSASACEKCGATEKAVHVQIRPAQAVECRREENGIVLEHGSNEPDQALQLIVRMAGVDFRASIGRDPDQVAIAFPDDNWMSRIQGVLVKEKGRLYYQNGFPGKLPTNPSLFCGIPLGNEKVELHSGSLLIIGSTVCQSQRYFSDGVSTKRR